MKHLLTTSFFLAYTAFNSSLVMQPPVISGAKVSFDTEEYDYGAIKQGGDGTCRFTLTNTGDQPLVIVNFQSSCGCLAPYFEKEPIQPGRTSILRARYDTNRPGPFIKTLTLTTNAVDRPVVALRIKGVVEPKEEVARPASTPSPEEQ